MTAVRDKMEVELTFNNRQFEQGVKQSTESITRLKQAVELKDQVGSLKEFKKVASSIGLPFSTLSKDIKTVQELGNTIDTLTKKTGLLHKAFDGVGIWIKKNLVDDVYKKVKGLVTAIPNQIISGGKARAQNIEQAQFQLKGLLKNKYDWEKISADIDFAVSGTRYGLDAAAKVAAQLSASNITFGDEMKAALRGVSGVAAMTNSEYEDIGHIFTTIAGQGKVMTQQLNQFANKGLNVAATLAEYYKVSEAQLREMVTKGKVDFKTFATAMNEAFGEQATKANDTFTGALSNVKASLSRMGAQFATPAFEEARKVLVMLIPVFKDIEKLIKPVSAGFEELAKAVSGFAVDTLRDIHFDLLDMVGAKGTGFSSQVNKVKEVFEDLHKSLDDTLKVEGKTTDKASEETIKNQKTSVDLYQAALDQYQKIEESSAKRIEAGEDEALVLYEQKVALLEVAKVLADYEEEIHGTEKSQKALTDQQKKYTDATSKSTTVVSDARNKALALYSTELSEAKLLKDNTNARRTYSDVINSTMSTAVKQSSTLGSSLLGLEKGDFGKSIKIVTNAFEEVKKVSDETLELDPTKKVDKVKMVTAQADATKKVYEAFDAAMTDINKTAEEYIKAGKDETEVNKQRESAIKALKDELAAFEKQNNLTLGVQDKANKGQEITNKLYENAKKSISGVSDKVLKLFGIEKEEGDQLSKNASEYKGLEEIALDVITGKYGNGEERKKALEDLGLSYSIIQNKVNELLGVEKRHEVTAEDEAKMAKYLGTSLDEAGDGAKKQKTTLEKLLTVLAGIGAAITIVKNAAGAVVNNIIRPFISWALPALFDLILSKLQWISEALIKANEIFDGDFFNTKTKEIADWFVNLGNKISEFWGKAKELHGVKRLQETFEKLKATLSEIGGKIWDKLLHGFESVGEETDSIFTMENMLNVLNSLADTVANFFDFIVSHKTDIENVLKALYNAFIFVTDAIYGLFTDPIGTMKTFGKWVFDTLNSVGDKVGAFFDKLAKDPKTTLTNAFNTVIKTLITFKNRLAVFFKSFFKADTMTIGDSVANAFDIKDAAASLFQKGRLLVKNFTDGVKAFFDSEGVGGKVITTVKNFIKMLMANFDPKKAAAIGGAGLFAVIAAKLAKFIGSIHKTITSIKELPAHLGKVLGGIGDVLNGYAMNLKSDALLKVAGAIGILTLAIVGLSFVDTEKVVTSAAALGGLMVAMAAVIAAIGMYNKAKAMVKASGVAEGIGEAVKTKVTSAGEKATETASENPFAPIYQSINGFLDEMKTALSKAIKMRAMGAFLLMLAGTIGILVLCVKALLKVDWENEGIPAAIAVGVMFAALVASVAILSKIGAGGLKAGTGIALIGLAASLYMLIGVIKIFAAWGESAADSLSTGLTYVALILLGFAGFSRLLKPEGLLSAAASLIVFSVGLVALVPPLLMLALIPTDMMAAGLLRMIECLGLLIVASMAAGKIQESGGGVTALLKMAGVLALLVPAMILLGLTGAIAGKGILELGKALAVLVVAAIVLNKFGGDGLEKLSSSFYNIAKGALILGPAIVLLGLCLAGFGMILKKWWPEILAGFLAFAAGLAVIGLIAKTFAAGFMAISMPLVALVAAILAFVIAAALLPGVAENLKGFFGGVISVIGGVASGIKGLFGLIEEQEPTYETALEKYDKAIDKLGFLSDKVKTELHNRFAELEHLNGADYSIGIDNLVGYIYGLDLTQEQIQTLLTETMTKLQESAEEQFTIAFAEVKADIAKLGLTEDEQADLLEKVKALASTVPGEFQTEIANLKTIIDNIIDDPTAAARIYSLAVNAARAEATYKTVIDELEIYLNKCNLSDQAKEKIKTSISNITASDLNTDYYISLSDLKMQIEDNELGLDEFQQKKLGAMVDAAIKSGTTANLLLNSVLVAIEKEAGIKLSDDTKENIRTTIENAAQLSLTNPEEAKATIDNFVLELGKNYGWKPDSQKLISAMVQKAFETKATLATKLSALGIYTNKLGLTDKNDKGLTFAEQVSAAINEQEFPTIELENIWVEVKNANMTPEEVEDLYTQVGNTISAAVDKEVALSNLKLALDGVPGIDETEKGKIIEAVEEMANLEGTEREAKYKEIVSMTYEMAEDSKVGREGVQQFINDLDIYGLQAEDLKTVTIESMKVAINGVEWGEEEGQTKQDFIDRIEEMAHLSGEPLKAAVENFIIALNNDPTIPKSVKTSLEEQARGLVDVYTSAYKEELEEFYKREAEFRRKKYIGAFVVDKGSGVTIKNGSAMAKGTKQFFEDAEEVTDEALNNFAYYIEEQIHNGTLSVEDLLSGIEGLEDEEEFINRLFPEGTAHSINPAVFREIIGPLVEAYVSGASAEFQHRLERDEPGKYNFDQWLIDRFTTTTGSGGKKTNWEALDQISQNADIFLGECEESVRDILGKYDDEITLPDILTALYSDDENIDKGLQSQLQDEAKRVMHDLTLFKTIWDELEEFRKDPEFEEETFFSDLEGTGEETAKLAAQNTNDAFATYYNLEPAKRTFVDKMNELMHAGEEVNPEQLYKEIDDIFETLGIHVREWSDDENAWVEGDLLTMEKVLGSDDPFGVFGAEIDANFLDALDKTIPGFRAAWNEWNKKTQDEMSKGGKRLAEETKEEISEDVAEGVEKGAEEAADKAKPSEGLGSLVEKIFTSDADGEGIADKAMETLSKGLQNGDYDVDELTSILTDKLSGGEGELDLSGLLGVIDPTGLLPKDISIGDIVNALMGKMKEGDLDASTLQTIGGWITGGVGEGMTGAMDVINSAVGGEGGIVPTVLNALMSLFVCGSPSEKTKQIGEWLDQGLAIGLITGKSKVIRQMMEVAKAAINVLKDRYDRFTSAGEQSGASYATGISNQNGLARIAGEMLGLAAEWAIRLSIDDAEDIGEDWGRGFVKGLESQVEDARAAGRKLAAAPKTEIETVGQIQSPSRVAMRLGNYWGMGYVIGLEAYVDKAGKVGRELGDRTIEALKTPMMLINDVLNSDMDASPVITPVLDLSSIQNGARAINGMIPTETRTLGYLSYSMGNRNTVTNADVVSAILGMSGKMDGVKGGDTYNINGVTYDDGSNIVDAVQTLVRAARVERRR